jgi:predicted nucleotidyltransferase
MGIDIVLSSKTSWKIMGYFFSRPWKKHYLREICRNAGTNPNTTFRLLKTMQKMGLFATEKVGRTITYSINKDNPYIRKLLELYHEDKIEYLAEFKIYVNRLRRKIHDIDPVSIILFGSVARGKASKYSDVDILFITEKKSKRNEKIENIFKPYSRYVQFVYFDRNEFRKEYNKGNEFIINILNHGIILHDKNFYYNFLFKNPPRPTKKMIEEKLEDIENRLDEIWEVYRDRKDRPVLLSGVSSLLYTVARQVAIATLLLNHRLLESKHVIPRQLLQINEKELSGILVKTRKCWDGELESLSDSEINDILVFLENKIRDCYEKLEVFQWTQEI